jgi:hypothetical protein
MFDRLSIAVKLAAAEGEEIHTSTSQPRSIFPKLRNKSTFGGRDASHEWIESQLQFAFQSRRGGQTTHEEIYHISWNNPLVSAVCI